MPPVNKLLKIMRLFSIKKKMDYCRWYWKKIDFETSILFYIDYLRIDVFFKHRLPLPRMLTSWLLPILLCYKQIDKVPSAKPISVRDKNFCALKVGHC